MTVAWAQNQVDAKIIANGSQTTFTYTLLHTFTSGNSLAGEIFWEAAANTITSVTDNASPSNTYTLLDTTTDVAGADFCQSFGLANIINVPTTITITCSVAPANPKTQTMVADEISGAGSINAHAALFNSSATSTPTSGNMTTTLPGCLVWGSTFPETGATFTAGSGFTLRLNDTTNNQFTESLTTNQASPGTIAATFNYGTAGTGTVMGIAFAPPVFVPSKRLVRTYYLPVMLKR